MTSLNVAILALYPDAGHVVPLLRIGAMLVARGHRVMCLLPDECSVLASSYGLTNTPIGAALSPTAIEASRGFGAHTIFAASFDVYYRDYYAAIFARSADMVEVTLRKLRPCPPDVVLVDDHQFSDVFAGIGAELNVPVLFHDSTGGLHSRSGSLAVNVYGKQMPRWKQAAILVPGFMYHASRETARLWRFRRDGLRDVTARARARLRVLLPKLPPNGCARADARSTEGAGEAPRIPHRLATGLGLLEHRHRGRALHPDCATFGPVLNFPGVPLPADLEQWLDCQPEKSVVYVSFGSMVTLSAYRLRMLVSAFGALGAPLLWALGGRRNLPSTFSLSQAFHLDIFVPQWSALSHPAIGACVTHGGAGTVLECMAAGIPMLVLPVIWDQPYNAQLVQDLGAGIRLDWWRLTDRLLARTLRTVLLAPEYRQRASSLAAELRAQRGSDEVLRFLERAAMAAAQPPGASWLHEGCAG